MRTFVFLPILFVNIISFSQKSPKLVEADLKNLSREKVLIQNGLGAEVINTEEY